MSEDNKPNNSQEEQYQQSEWEKPSQNKYFDIHGPVFWPSVVLIVTFIVTTLVFDNTKTITTSYNGSQSIGATIDKVDQDQKDSYNLTSGVTISNLEDGFLKEAGLGDGYIIKNVNGGNIETAQAFRDSLQTNQEKEISMDVVSPGFGTDMEATFDNVKNGITGTFGWLFVIAVNIFLVFMIFLGSSKFGSIRLGGKDAKPEFSTLAWFSMLFSAGMGIGILFWSVAEPVYFFNISPPMGEGGTAEAAQRSMDFAYLHWGFHAWGIYALVGMALAFFAYNRKLPLSIRSVFYPVFGKRIHGPLGDGIDTLAVLADLFGLATSLGIGVLQISAGFSYLFAIEDSLFMQVTLIIIITIGATISVILGIDKGVKFLSEWNIRIGAVFLLFMIIVGPTVFILDSFVQNTGSYVQQFINMGFWTESYNQTEWQNAWTLFYWAWWISWSPFVGMFIARVSRGRTVREFVFGVLLVPSLITFLWLSAFGGSAIYLELNQITDITSAVKENTAVALFELLSNFPWAMVTSFVGVLLVMSFFVTSSDSGSLVIDSLTSGGKIDAPVGQRIFWANTEGAVAAVLLIGGGLEALRTAAVTTGLPFTFVLLLMCYSLYKGLSQEHAKEVELQKTKERKSYEDYLADLLKKQRGGNK